MAANRPLDLTAVADGTSNTFLAAETDSKGTGVVTTAPGGMWAYGYIGYDWKTTSHPLNTHDHTAANSGGFRSELAATAADGTTSPAPCKPGEHALRAEFAARPRVAAGSAVSGPASRGAEPAVLVYHPNAVFGPAAPAAVTVGPAAEAEAVPEQTPGGLRVRSPRPGGTASGCGTPMPPPASLAASGTTR